MCFLCNVLSARTYKMLVSGELKLISNEQKRLFIPLTCPNAFTAVFLLLIYHKLTSLLIIIDTYFKLSDSILTFTLLPSISEISQNSYYSFIITSY